MIYSFTELKVWQEASNLRKEIEILSKSFPSEEKYRLTDQIIRASRSITNNIAEGFGRFHYQENIQFCRQARGSLFEVLDHLLIAMDNKFITKENFENLKIKFENELKLINGYIKYLRDKKIEDKS
ncbi:MAG: four helix bundle protein [Ignavibacteriae bacterium]|nr:four helix bundle protein [Ignavibacteriota bacterium]